MNSSDESGNEPEVGYEGEAQSRLPAPNDEKSKIGSLVRVDFILRDAEGIGVQADQDSFTAILGSGQLLSRIEGALMGLSVGNRAKLRLPPNEAFGDRDIAKVIEFDRDEFPSDVAAGDHFEAEQEGGAVLVLRIVEVRPEFVKVDLNHPLAGQSIELEFLIRDIRQASEQELSDMRALANNPSTGSSSGLMPVGRLLRGRPER